MSKKLVLLFVSLLLSMSSFGNYNPEIRSDEVFMGDKDAPITLVAYYSFQCPFSAHGNRTLKQLLNKYKGGIRIAYKHYPRTDHPHSRLAAMYFEAIRLQDPEKALVYQQKLLDDPQILSEGESRLNSIAQELKIDMGILKKDLKSEKVINRINADESEAKKFKISFAPAYIFKGQYLQGARPIKYFEDLMTEEEKKKYEVATVTGKKIEFITMKNTMELYNHLKAEHDKGQALLADADGDKFFLDLIAESKDEKEKAEFRKMMETKKLNRVKEAKEYKEKLIKDPKLLENLKRFHASNIMKIHLKMTRDQVLQIFGKPHDEDSTTNEIAYLLNMSDPMVKPHILFGAGTIEFCFKFDKENNLTEIYIFNMGRTRKLSVI